MTRSPILTADNRLDPRTSGTVDKSIVFVCGAAVRGNEWVISYGHHDQFCELAMYSLGEIESVLERVD
jgi:predicted GH43/DUF377 family glycosyl hydrolase